MTRQPDGMDISENDPPRWRLDPATSPTADGKNLGSDLRALAPPRDLDDVRFAQIRQHVVSADPLPRRRELFLRWRWVRVALFALVFLMLGGVATTLAARPYLLRLRRAIGAAPAAPAATEPQSARAKPRRWRVAVRDAAELELSVAAGGTEISVLDGQAELTGPSVAAPILLSPGRPWREADEGTRPAAAPPPPPARPSAENGAPARAARPAVLAKVGSSTALPSTDRVGSTSPPAPTLEPPAFQPPLPPLAERPVPSPHTAPAVPSAPRTLARALVPEGPAEAFLVTSALRALRADGAPSVALAKLDERDRRFPNGMLQREAALARVEALLKLGRRGAALAVLQPMDLGARGADRNVLLARAELRAEAGRCAQAGEDFDRLLESAPADEVADRALFGRARCAMRAGHWERAQADLDTHLARFPEAKRRAEVEEMRRQIATSRSETAGTGAADGASRPTP